MQSPQHQLQQQQQQYNPTDEFQRQRDLYYYLSNKIVQTYQDTSQIEQQVLKLKEQSRDSKLQDMIKNNLKTEDITKYVNLKSYQVIIGHQSKVISACWHPDSKHILTAAAQDDFIIVTDATKNYKKTLIQLDDPYVSSIDVSNDGQLIATGGLDSICYVYKLDQGYLSNIPELLGQPLKNKKRCNFLGHTEYISDVKFLNNSQQVLSASGDRLIKLWDLNKGGQISSFSKHLGDVLAIAVNKMDSNSFVSASSDRKAVLWDIRDPNKSRSFDCAKLADSTSVQFHPENYSFAVGSDDGSIRLFDIRCDSEISFYSNQDVHSHMRKKNILNNGVDMSMYYDDVRSIGSKSSKNVQNKISTQGVESLDFSKSGRLLFVSYADYNSVVVWDTLTGMIVSSLDGHRDFISQVRVSNDGYGIATGSADRTIRIWSTI